MKTFKNQQELTAHFEGFSAKAYQCPAGVWTIGFGETMPNGRAVTPNMTCTPAQANLWLQLRMSGLTLKLEDTYRTKTLAQSSAIADYAYNAGPNAFPALLKKLKAEDFQGASLEFLDGIYCNKKPLLGLLLRRISEYNTFVNGTYIAWEKGDSISQDLKAKLLAKNAKNQDAVNMINQFKVQ